ncbi:MAG: glycosyltransferase [Sphingomonas sp.]|nr:glycosyltransferase [Sphingomonas sp.]
MRQPVSIIVPAFNAESTLTECLNALREAMLPEDELILFDDGSTDSTRAIAEKAGARIVRNPGAPKGPAHGRNTAAVYATKPYLMFVDADVIIHPDAIDRLVQEARSTGAVGAFGSYDDHPRSRRLPALYANLRHHFVHQRGSRDATTFWSGIGLIETDVFRDFGGYDEKMFAHPSIEDVELGMRLIDSGRKIRLVPEAQGTHWKDWTLWRVWHTDVVRRALPWCRLIADGQLAVPDLNLAKKERMLALAALAIPVFVMGGFFKSAAWLIAVALIAAYLFGIREFLGVLSKRMNPLQVAAAAAMHWFYHVYASATYALVLLGTRLGLRHPADRDAPLPLKRAELAQ